MLKDQLDKRLFWDVDYGKLDVDKRSQFVIERVLDKASSLKEFRAILDYYGREKVMQAARHARELNNKSLHFCSVYFDIPLKEFRCYNIKQSLPQHWHS